MKIMYCPQCGGKVRSESIGWKCESCHGFIDMQGGFHPHKEEPFMPPMTNADRIRASSDEQLALFFKELMFNDFKPACKKSTFFSAEHKPECEEDCVSCILKLLQQPAEEDT